MSSVKNNAACHAWIAVTGHLTLCVLYVGPSVSHVSTIIIPFTPAVGSNRPVPSTCFYFYHPSTTFCNFVTTFCKRFFFFLSLHFFLFLFTVYLLFILFKISVLSPGVTLCGWQDVKIQLLTTYISPFHTSRPGLVLNWLFFHFFSPFFSGSQLFYSGSYCYAPLTTKWLFYFTQPLHSLPVKVKPSQKHRTPCLKIVKGLLA